MNLKSKIFVLLCFLPCFVRGIDPALTPIVEYLTELGKTHREDPSSATPIVGIAGCPGVGKTTLTKTLLGALEEQGIHGIVLPLDHFNYSPQERKKIGTDWDIRHLKVPQLHLCLGQIASGELLVEKPTCNQLTGEIGSELLDLNGVDLVLFDGMYALCTRSCLNFFQYCVSGIFVESDEANISQWKWEREQKKTHPRNEEQFAAHMEVMLSEYREQIAYSKENALIVIKKEKGHHYVVDVKSLENEVDCACQANSGPEKI